MFALSRFLQRSRRINLGSARVGSGRSDVTSNHAEGTAIIVGRSATVSVKHPSSLRLYHTEHASSSFFTGRRMLSSKTNVKDTKEEDELEDGFSELETASASDAVHGSDSESEIGDDILSDVPSDEDDTEEADQEKKGPVRKRASSKLFEAIVKAPGLSVGNALDKWVEEGNDLDRSEISLAAFYLRKRQMYGRALQLSEWLESSKKLEFTEPDHASRLDLIAKVRGLKKAENYIEKIPKSFQGELIYRTLLANCAVAKNLKKAEELFNKMKDDLGLPVTTFACNQLLLLYKRFDQKKIADMLLLMEKENVKPSALTYKILIDVKGSSGDVAGMDKILEMMKSEGVELNDALRASFARHYHLAGHKEKAEAFLKELEGGDLKGNRKMCQILLSLYADLGRADDVRRIWEVCEPNPWFLEYLAAIEAWGKLSSIKEAEAAFEAMLKKSKKPSPKMFYVMLRVYADHKMLDKAKFLVKSMADCGARIDPSIWDMLVKLFVEAGDIERADAFLNRAAEQDRMRPQLSSYTALMEAYAKRGDVHNSEKIAHRLRQSGYGMGYRQFEVLVEAYMNAKTPAYGIRERIRAENVFPNKALGLKLDQVDPFRKNNIVANLLD